ncbi:nuclease-related domain-containing protein [Microbacterium sp. QXD-8]|uniref:Nuclease-related domain-containing protein n=1 Tax=Microbacterium psychrotolerans TaxID=3068321 RepID=A0ABU0Z1P5_9MICO|nr:nuclease-related domain-containing protein [Microbacterium sp. QXD-8]MDQ7878494.1 nuclease-related domain-containing protein [Microbacterium sp. QXD-8]
MTLELGPDDKRMRLRYAGTCRLCGQALAAGVEAIYEREMKTVRCIDCTAIKAAPEPGTAGGSARREYERRKDSREQRIRTNHPKLGGLILALSDDPQSTKAWERGAVGEELMARRLADLPDTFRVLHDRRIPGTRANIDHIAIGPSGVWVIDAKRYVDKRPALQVEGGLFRPRVESLRIGGRDGTKLVQGVQSQVARVAAALGDELPLVTGVLCFLEADRPLIGGSFTVAGVQVLWPRLLVKRMVEAPPQTIDVDSIHSRLATAFPSA